MRQASCAMPARVMPCIGLPRQVPRGRQVSVLLLVRFVQSLFSHFSSWLKGWQGEASVKIKDFKAPFLDKMGEVGRILHMTVPTGMRCIQYTQPSRR